MAIAYPYTVPADQAFMGKERTYRAQTEFRQQAVRLRAIVDNPCDPAEAGAIGRDWAVDEPHAIVEEGSNANGSYTLYAGGQSKQVSKNTDITVVGGGGSFNVDLPIFIVSQEEVYAVRTSNTGANYLFMGDVPVSLTNFKFNMIVGYGSVSSSTIFRNIIGTKIGRWY